MILWGVRRRFHRLSPGHGHVAHALRTLAPVAARSIATPALPLDLHVLSLPLAFILSQDQTLLCIYTFKIPVRPRQLHSHKNQRSRFKKFSVLACTNLSLFSKNFVLEIIPTPSIPLKGDDQRLSARRQAGPTGGIFNERRCFIQKRAAKVTTFSFSTNFLWIFLKKYLVPDRRCVSHFENELSSGHYF